MKRMRKSEERIYEKSFLSAFSTRLQKGYSLSPIEAETLSREIHDFLQQNQQQYLSEGQVLYTAVLKTEPAGRALKLCKTRQIKLTVFPTDLIETFYKNKRCYFQEMVHRLSWEALAQDCVLTQEDLARLLHSSVSSIKRIISWYRQQDILIPTRGNYVDVGPGLSHKSYAVRLYLQGKSIVDIAKQMAHSIYAIERYIDHFTLVYSAYVNEGFTPLRISKIMSLSLKLVEEYIALYEQYKDNPDYGYQFQQIAKRSRFLYTVKKKKINQGGQQR